MDHGHARALVVRLPTSLRQRSGDGGTIEQWGRLARQALKALGDAGRNRLRGICDGRQIGRDRRNAQDGAARSRRGLVVPMPGVVVLGMIVFGVIVLDGSGIGGMCRMVPMRGVPVHMCGGSRPGPGHQAGRGVADRQRNAGGEHAKQIEQGGIPPRFSALPSCQANEHPSRLSPIDSKLPLIGGFAKAEDFADGLSALHNYITSAISAPAFGRFALFMVFFNCSATRRSSRFLTNQ